jgi:hypothetical protein
MPWGIMGSDSLLQLTAGRFDSLLLEDSAKIIDLTSCCILQQRDLTPTENTVVRFDSPLHHWGVKLQFTKLHKFEIEHEKMKV